MSSQTGNDTLVLGNIAIVDTADGQWVGIDFPNTKAEMKVGKGGNAIIALNAQGDIANVDVRVIRGSYNDQQLNSLLRTQDLEFAAFPLLSGQLVKRVGDGRGNVTSDTYYLAGGFFRNNVNASSNADADTNQSVSEYHFQFAKAARAIFA